MDKQAAARVWRDGQTKRCFIYRFLTTGTIEEKIYQRQLSKEGLSGVLGGSTADASLTKEELRDLFQLDARALEQPSDTHQSLECGCMEPYQIRTEEEATKADAAASVEAEQHAQVVAAEDARRRAEGGDEESKENGAIDVAEPGAAPAAAAAPASHEHKDASAMDESAEGATGEGGEGEEGGGEEGGEGGGGAGEDSSSSDDDGGEEMADFVVEGSDDDEAEYGSKKKGKGGKAAQPKKHSKKDGPRKQRKRRSRVGSLNFPQLHALSNPTLGQRGEPPEEELVNWAHHATSNSIPDPLFRLAASQSHHTTCNAISKHRGTKGGGCDALRSHILPACFPFVCFGFAETMPLVAGSKLPYVSFVFSCEISGKAIVGSSDADDALTAATLGTERAGSGIVIDHDVVLTIGYLIAEAESVWTVPPLRLTACRSWRSPTILRMISGRPSGCADWLLSVRYSTRMPSSSAVRIVRLSPFFFIARFFHVS